MFGRHGRLSYSLSRAPKGHRRNESLSRANSCADGNLIGGSLTVPWTIIRVREKVVASGGSSLPSLGSLCRRFSHQLILVRLSHWISRRVPGDSILTRPPPRREIHNLRTPRGRRIAGRARTRALAGNLLDGPSSHLVSSCRRRRRRLVVVVVVFAAVVVVVVVAITMCKNSPSTGRKNQHARHGAQYAERKSRFARSTHRTKIS